MNKKLFTENTPGTLVEHVLHGKAEADLLKRDKVIAGAKFERFTAYGHIQIHGRIGNGSERIPAIGMYLQQRIGFQGVFTGLKPWHTIKSLTLAAHVNVATWIAAPRRS